ncbi:MAG: amino acid permease [Bacteroidales bacterium]|nr:amino acid permease [Bacteroidales bacterium]
MKKASDKFGWSTASAFIIANMIGTGVFTSLGFQLVSTQNLIAILLLWFLGGVIAFCGAVSYGELGAAMPRSGGEYHYLSNIYHPAVGFLAGWVSLIVGFAAPIALSCIALSSYVSNIFPVVNAKLLAIAVLTLITVVHAISRTVSGRFQNVFTALKVIVIIGFIIAGFILPAQYQSFAPSVKEFSASTIFNTSFGVSLVWVYYAYSGWNAAIYMAGDLKNPQKNLPRALLLSTLTVTILYMLLNLVFLLSTPSAELTGEVEVGLISARHIFGTRIGNMMGLIIALLLLSSISSMVYVGPRVSQVMGEDYRILGFLSRKNKRDIPIIALVFQFVVALLLILTGSFSLVTQYTGILLSMCSLATVAGVFVHRRRFPDAERPYKTWGYPVTPIIFCILILASISYLVYDDYLATFVRHDQKAMWMSIMSAGTLLVGGAVYFANKLIKKK